MKALLLSLAILATFSVATQAQSKTAPDTDSGPSYGKYMEVQPMSYTSSANGKKITLQHNPKRTEPIQNIDQGQQRIEGKLIADAKPERQAKRHEELNKGE